MLNITATSLRGNLFAILKRVESGEKVVITHNKKKVAYIKPVKKTDWRKQSVKKPKPRPRLNFHYYSIQSTFTNLWIVCRLSTQRT